MTRSTILHPRKQLKVPVSKSTPTAKRELLFENATTLSRHNTIASFSDICTYSMSDVGGGGERWRIPETQVGVTFQGPPPVLRQWIHRPQRRKSPRRLKMWLPTRRSSDQTPALMDGARVCFMAPLAFEASAHSCWLSLQAASLARQHIRSWHSAISSLFIWSDYWILSHMESTWTTVWSFCSGQM